MRKTTVFLLLLCTIFLHASDIDVSFFKKADSSAVILDFKDNLISHSLDCEQLKDGRFSLAMPPFLNIETKNFKIGEIKFSKHDMTSVINPSFNPSYGGIAYNGKSFAFAALSPVFSPKSPAGFFSRYKNESFFISVLYTNPGNYSEKDIPTQFQTDWTQLQNRGNTVNAFLQLSTPYSESSLNLTYNRYKGINSVLESSIERNRLAFSTVLNGFSYSEISYQISEEPVSKIIYSQYKGTKPLYGGTSREARFTYTFMVRFEAFEFSVSSVRNYEKSTGYFSSTDYRFSYTIPGLHADADFCLLRTKGSQMNLYLSELELRANNVLFQYKSGKTYLEISKTIHICGTDVKISVNQKRELGIEFGFEL